MMAVVSMMHCENSESVQEARIVTVSRGDVHQVIGISGRLSYAEEHVVLSPLNGVVDRVHVKSGQRIGEGEAVLRLHSDVQGKILSTYTVHETAVQTAENMLSGEGWISASEGVIRADAACTVRQIYVEENMPVSAGMPVMRMTSGEQEIRCSAAAADTEKIRPGMWAWLQADNELIGLAYVENIGPVEAEETTGLCCASIVLKPEQHIDLPEGAIIDADIYLAGSDDVMTLPLEAITTRNTVWWVNEGRCTEISAEMIMADEINAWVALPEGIQVAIGEFVEGQLITEAGR